MRVFQITLFSMLLGLPQLVMSQEKSHILLEDRVSIYPNPIINGVLNLEIIDDNEGTVAIYDFLGNKVFDIELDIPAAHKYKLYLSELSPGKYFVKINIENVVITKKISIV